MNLTPAEISNSNILALTAGLLFRLASGPLCDRFGPRMVFVCLLLTGALPTALAGTISSVQGLYVIRFCIGILGATLVPCQVWSTAFFDKNVVGSATALTGGWGNAGGGITYFVMPAIFDSLVHRGLTEHVAWRVAFIVPFILITSCALGMLFLCPDTPTGKWSERHLLQVSSGQIVESNIAPIDVTTADTVAERPTGEKVKVISSSNETSDIESGVMEVVDAYNHEVVVPPSFKEVLAVYFSPQTLVIAGAYLCSFGSELSINSILGAYYFQNFAYLGQTGAGQRAAIFGLVNAVFRPIGGFVSDMLYKYIGGNKQTMSGVWAKRIWLHSLGIAAGVFAFAIGFTDPHHLPTMIGLVLGLAFCMDAGNGAVFATTPHVHPHANGK